MLGAGKYVGRAVVTFLPGGRLVELTEPFGYIDPDGKRWDVLSGAIVDGASIPQPFWSVIGGPFEGTYREASIIHDWYCSVRTEPWRAVHRVFYDAMITSSTPIAKAKIMYAAVYWGGPRWTEMDIRNTVLSQKKTFEAENLRWADFNAPLRWLDDGSSQLIDDKDTVTVRVEKEIEVPPYHYAVDKRGFDSLRESIEKMDLDLDTIDVLVEDQLKGTEKRSWIDTPK